MDYLDEYHRIQFPDPHEAESWGLVATGGNLSPGILLSAYEQGIFPWYSRKPILWFSPDPRFVLYLDRFHVGKRLYRTVKKRVPEITFDTRFDTVIEACRKVRKKEGGTWITLEMLRAYKELQRLGYAHSVEVWEQGELTGGLYGVGFGSFFAGESMFSMRSDASKFAFIALAGLLHSLAVPMIDCQAYTNHLASFGAEEIPRSRFLLEIPPLHEGAAIPGNWRHRDGAALLQRGLDLSNENRCRQ